MMLAANTVRKGEFAEAQRVVAGVTAGVEKRVLAWLAPRVPRPITSDHLTLLGLAATATCGLLYAASARWPWLLLAVNVGLVLNWLGDSLDGAVARHRRCERPRFGFYVDHLADAFGVLLLLVGLGLSGLMSSFVAATVLAAYFLLAIETYLATYTLREFRISWGPVGGTELRVLLAALNLVAMVSPGITVGRMSWLLFDVVGLATAVALIVIAAAAGVRGTRALAREEGWAPRGEGPLSSEPADPGQPSRAAQVPRRTPLRE